MSQKWYKIDASCLQKANRKSCALYQMTTLPMTLSDTTQPKYSPVFCILHLSSYCGKSEAKVFKFCTQVAEVGHVKH